MWTTKLIAENLIFPCNFNLVKLIRRKRFLRSLQQLIRSISSLPFTKYRVYYILKIITPKHFIDLVQSRLLSHSLTPNLILTSYPSLEIPSGHLPLQFPNSYFINILSTSCILIYFIYVQKSAIIYFYQYLFMGSTCFAAFSAKVKFPLKCKCRKILKEYREISDFIV